MGQKEKLIERLKSKPKTFTFDDAESLLRYFAYGRVQQGRTKRVPDRSFVSEEHPTHHRCTDPTPEKSCWNIR